MQTYEEYLETMRVYRFYPSSREEWQTGQMHLHGYFLGCDSITVSGRTVTIAQASEYPLIHTFKKWRCQRRVEIRQHPTDPDKVVTIEKPLTDPVGIQVLREESIRKYREIIDNKTTSVWI